MVDNRPSGFKRLLKTIADPNEYSHFNTVFGEQITAERHTEIIEEFQYNINTKTLTTTTANGGTVTPDDANLLFDFPMARQDSKEVDVRHYHFALEPGETVTITGQSSQSNDITFFASWREEF